MHLRQVETLDIALQKHYRHESAGFLNNNLCSIVKNRRKSKVCTTHRACTINRSIMTSIFFFKIFHSHRIAIISTNDVECRIR